MKRILFSIVALVVAFPVCASAFAQVGGQGRQRGERGAQQGPRATDERAAPRGAPAMLSDSMVALERELPSLRIDLKLAGEQRAAFDSFERAARAAAEVARTRLKRIATLRNDKDKPVTAIALLSGVADDDIERATVMKDVLAKLRVLYDSLGAEQKAILDRRFLQSQTEPLGSS